MGVLMAAASFPLAGWWVRRHGALEPGRLEVMLLLIGCSWLGEFFGLTSLLGTLLGGTLFTRLAPMEEGSLKGQELLRVLGLLSEVFLPLYSLSVGMRIDAGTLLQSTAWSMASLLIVLGIACNLICALGIGRGDRAAGVDRWVVVFGLIPRGLPGLVFASTALGAGVIRKAQFSSLVLTVAVTTVLGLLLLARRLRWLEMQADATRMATVR
ncbi:cation:proton antiporter [Synechococcus sp. CS-1333]|uniref:cation:proton antiporter domain-containing protein n=1 Tax=Synechococcus sp. CS-1333 TaxID=2848638 RepID=UPI0021E4C68A|nr:cation:proton antiporter [Synechococcus sp. CS-1333]